MSTERVNKHYVALSFIVVIHSCSLSYKVYRLEQKRCGAYSALVPEQSCVCVCVI